MTTPTTFRCNDCSCAYEKPKGGISTGYGIDKHGFFACFDCCGKRDIADMTREGKTTLYLVRYEDQDYVTNWTATLRIKARVSVGRHNIAGRRYDADFIGPDGKRWHGVQYGDNTQLIHCKRAA